jgi:hypothetical protein
MNVRFHLSYDLASKSWFLEAHDIKARRWFLVPADTFPVQLQRLCSLGISKSECLRLTALEAAGKVSAWVENLEIDTVALIEVGFVLQSTTAAPPRHLTTF